MEKYIKCYWSVRKHLMLKAIEHVKLYTSITQQQLDITLHARKSLLLSKDKPWRYNMGSYDDADIC